MFLAAALAAATPVIVSGDHHFLAVSGWRGIAVVKPRQFLSECIEPPSWLPSPSRS